MRLLLGLATVAGAFPAIAAAQGPRTASNLVTHSEVTIDRAASAVWPFILNPGAWKKGSQLWHRSGPPGQVGEVFAAGDSVTAEVAFLVENVELVTERRRTIKLYLPSGTLLGFATWWLRPTPTGTAVGYDVYSETLIPAGAGISADSLRQIDRAGYLANTERFDEELRALKHLVESSNGRHPR